MAYNAAQLQAILRQAGWPEDRVMIMAAIGLAESGGNPGIRNPNLARENSIGLWQINRYAHPQYPENALRDPLYNARAALDVYRLQGLRAWGAYTDGRYRKYLPQSQAAYSQAIPQSTASVVTSQGVTVNPVLPASRSYAGPEIESVLSGSIGMGTGALLLLAGAGILTVYLISD